MLGGYRRPSIKPVPSHRDRALISCHPELVEGPESRLTIATRAGTSPCHPEPVEGPESRLTIAARAGTSPCHPELVEGPESSLAPHRVGHPSLVILSLSKGRDRAVEGCESVLGLHSPLS